MHYFYIHIFTSVSPKMNFISDIRAFRKASNIDESQNKPFNLLNIPEEIKEMPRIPEPRSASSKKGMDINTPVVQSKEPDKTKLYELMNQNLKRLQIDLSEVKQQEKVYTFATNSSMKLQQKPIKNECLDESYHQYCRESRQLPIQPELCNALDHMFTDWQTQFLDKANLLVTEFLEKLKSLNPYSGTFLDHFERVKTACSEIAQDYNTLLKLNSDTQSLSKTNPNLIQLHPTEKARLESELDNKYKFLLTHLNAFWGDITAFVKFQNPEQRDIITLSNQLNSYIEQFLAASPQDQMSVILNQSFIRLLEDVIRQLTTSAIEKAELEEFNQRRTDLLDSFETMNHLKAYLVNPKKPANYESDSKIRDELYRITSMIWSCKVYIHTGFVNAEGVNRVDFYFPDGFPFTNLAEFITLLCNTVGISHRDVSLLENPVDNKKLALNIGGGADNIRKLKDKAQDLPKCSIKIGSFEINLGHAELDSRYNRIYGKGADMTYWEGNCNDGIDRGRYPYYCPVGWKRFSLKVGDFDQKYTGWPVAYHGTKENCVALILSGGLKTFNDIDIRGNSIKAAFFSPCIEYSASPRYAKIYKESDNNYIQIVLQCRVNPNSFKVQPETMGASKTRIHPLYDNKKIEWYIESKTDTHLTTKDYVCYGIMVRSCPDPRSLPESHWWYRG